MKQTIVAYVNQTNPFFEPTSNESKVSC